MACESKVEISRHGDPSARRSAARPRRAFGATARWAGMLLAGVCLGGCSRVLTITQDAYINTAGQDKRAEAERTGDPLELNIVCVTPQDLKKDVNADLKPGSGITSEVWFRKRPIDGDEKQKAGRFDLPKKQVYLLTNDMDAYGTRKGPALRGSEADGPKKTTEGDIAFPFGALHDSDSVIYVFGKFKGPDGAVLPVQPARFAPPGAFTHELSIHVGVEKSRFGQGLDKGQYIKVMSDRKMHGKGD